MQTAEWLRSAFGKKKLPGRLLLAALMLAGGCDSMSPTDKGVLGGATLGGVAGGLIGAATHHTALGAVAGTVLGGAAGGLAGNEVEKSEQRQNMRLAAAQAAQPPLSLTDIASLTQSNTSDDIIINQIRASGSIYHMTAAQIQWLQQNGVHDAVIREMQATAWRAPRPVYGAPPPVVVVEQPVYAPPPVVGVGFGWRGGFR